MDVSFLAGMLVDKFRYHLPLYRQHRRLADSGVRVSRGSLTNWAGRAIDLLEPVVAAQAAHILQGAVIAMDETSVKAGRVSPGKMRTGYFWPVYGEAGELVFHYAPSRAHKHVEAFLGDFRGTLLSDGYAAYEAYARRHGITHGQCWAHCRRNFTDAKESEPAGVAEALSLIGGLYAHEKAIRKKKLTGPSKLAHRRERATPAVEAFFDWCQAQRQRLDLLPSSPFGQALAYAAARETGASSVPGRPRGEYRHQSSGAGLAADPGRAAQLAVRVDGARRPAHRRDSEFAGDVPVTKRQSVHLPGRCLTARRPASGPGRHRVDPAGYGRRGSRTARYARTCNGLGIPHLNKPPKSITASFARLHSAN